MIISGVQIIQGFLSFARKGKTSTSPAGTVGPDILPVGTDASVVSLGRCKDWELKFQDKKMDIILPDPNNPGITSLGGRKRPSQFLEYMFTVGEITPIAMGLAFRTDSELDASSTQWVPGSGGSTEGWLYGAHYNDDKQAVFGFNLYGELTLESGWQGGVDKLVEPKFVFACYANALNTASNPNV